MADSCIITRSGPGSSNKFLFFSRYLSLYCTLILQGQLDESFLDTVLPPSNLDSEGESDSNRRPDHDIDDEPPTSRNIVREKSKTGNGKVTKTGMSGHGPMPKSRKGRPKSVQIKAVEKLTKAGVSGNGPMPKSCKGRPKSVRVQEEEAASENENVAEVESVSNAENGLNPKRRRGRPKSVRIKEEDEANEPGKTSQGNNNESDYSRKYKPRHRKPLDEEEQNGSAKGLRLFRFQL